MFGLGRIKAIAFAMLIAAPAFAGEVDFSATILDAEEAPVPDCIGADCAGKPPLTLSKVAVRSLTASFEDERNLSGEEKFKRGQLALKVHAGGLVSLSVEEIALIKKLIAKGYGPLIVLRTWSILDPVK